MLLLKKYIIKTNVTVPFYFVKGLLVIGSPWPGSCPGPDSNSHPVKH